MSRERKVTAAISAAKTVVGGPAYAIANDGSKVAVAIETSDGKVTAFEYQPGLLDLAIRELEAARSAATIAEHGGDPVAAKSRIVEPKGGHVALSDDGTQIILMLEDDQQRYLFPLGPQFAQYLIDHLDKAIRAGRSETSGIKGSA